MEPVPGSFGDLLRREHIDAVWRMFRRRLRDEQLAWDATQDLFERVRDRFDRFDPRRGSFEGWVLGFVENVAREVRRRERRHLPLEAVDADARRRPWIEPDREPFPDLPAALAREIDALSERDRTILVLRVEGWRSVAIGELLGMSPTNVTTRLTRIRQRISRRLELPDVA